MPPEPDEIRIGNDVTIRGSAISRLLIVVLLIFLIAVLTLMFHSEFRRDVRDVLISLFGRPYAEVSSDDKTRVSDEKENSHNHTQKGHFSEQIKNLQKAVDY